MGRREDAAMPVGALPLSVIARTMQVLEAVGDAESPISLTELSAITGLPMTTSHRLSSDLVAAGMLERVGDRLLRIGPRLWELGRHFEPAERLRLIASRFLRDLHEVSRATIELSRFDGHELVVVDRYYAPGSGTPEWRANLERLSLEHSPAGIAVLAASPIGVVDERRSALSPPEVRAFERVLAEVRAAGVAGLSRGESSGHVTMAAAIRDRRGVQGAVSLEARNELSARAHVPSLMVTVRRIGAALDN